MSDNTLSPEEIDRILARLNDEMPCQNAIDAPTPEDWTESFIKTLRQVGNILDNEFALEYYRLREEHESAIVRQVKALIQEETKLFTRQILELYKKTHGGNHE